MHTGPCPFQPVQGIGLQRRHNSSQRWEIFAYPTLLLEKYLHKSDLLLKIVSSKLLSGHVFVCLPTWAMSIHRWMTRALTWGLICLCFSTVLTTHAATALNWVMVARMVGALCLLFFLSLWDQIEPRQWWGTTFLNNSWSKRTGSS